MHARLKAISHRHLHVCTNSLPPLAPPRSSKNLRKPTSGSTSNATNAKPWETVNAPQAKPREKARSRGDVLFHPNSPTSDSIWI